MPIFRVKSVKIYTGQKKFTRTPSVTNMRYVPSPEMVVFTCTHNMLFLLADSITPITLCKGCPVPLVEMRYADNACSSLFNDLYKFCLFSVISLVLAIEPPQQFSKSIWRLGYWRYKKAAHKTSQWKYFELRASHFKHIQLEGESKFSVMIGWVLQKYDSSWQFYPNPPHICQKGVFLNIAKGPADLCTDWGSIK